MEKKKYLARFKLMKYEPPLEKKLLYEVINELTTICHGLGLGIQDDGENYVFSIKFADDSMEVIGQVKDLIERKNREALSADEVLEAADIQKSTVPPIANTENVPDSRQSRTPPSLMDKLIEHLKRMKNLAIELIFNIGDRLDKDDKKDDK